jgi:hypothetical protein
VDVVRALMFYEYILNGMDAKDRSVYQSLFRQARSSEAEISPENQLEAPF